MVNNKFNLDDYEMVKDRLPLFYERYPDGRITCEILSETPEGVTMKAYLYKNLDEQCHQAPLATGIAHEKPGGFIDKYYENCETSGIGRALANLNLRNPNKDRPSREEMESAQSMQASKPSAPQSNGASRPSNGNPAKLSDKQRNLLVELGYDGSQGNVDELGRSQASDLITEYITKQKRQQPSAPQ